MTRKWRRRRGGRTSRSRANVSRLIRGRIKRSRPRRVRSTRKVPEKNYIWQKWKG
jgi:hypothetical protein